MKDQRILELGCGTGFCGLVAAKLGFQVTLTDVHTGVLGLLVNSASRVNAKVERLDWEDQSAAMVETDVVIGSDLVYDPRLVIPLVKVLRTIKFNFALICCAVRQRTTLDFFKRSICDANIHIEEIVSTREAWNAIRHDNFFTGDESDLDIILYRVSK